PPCRLARRHAVRHPVALRLSASVLPGPGHGRKRPSAGHYPVKLRHDIRSVVRFERADLAARLTLAHVTAAIQYHLRTAPRNRPLGAKLCAELHWARRRETA